MNATPTPPAPAQAAGTRKPRPVTTAAWSAAAITCAGLLFAPQARADGPAAASAPLQTIASLDLPRYMGQWYELARYPNRFQRQCTGPATARYTLQAGGTVQVVNRCPQGEGKVDEAIGEARRIGGEGSARLQVRFAPAWLSLLPMVWGDYWVVELDPDYQLAVISEPKREYLWVLSRQASLDSAAWAALTTRLKAMGFEPERLLRTAP